MAEARQSQTTRVVLVTGPSGAGRSTAIDALEDIGYEAIDNLPLSLVDRLFQAPLPSRPLALGIDARNRDFSTAGLVDAVERLSRLPGIEPDLLYLDCNRETLLRRFSETRRRHPMAPEESPELGIDREYDLLAAARHRADLLIDTSGLSPHDLRAEIERWYEVHGAKRLAVSVYSFSYKRGVPRGVDMVLDCRFLANPHWVKDLRHLTGLDKAVGDHIRADARFDAFAAQLETLMQTLLPAYRDEGKSHFALAFGCTGGQHRSVYLAQNFGTALAQAGWRVSIRHHELERRAGTGVTPA